MSEVVLRDDSDGIKIVSGRSYVNWRLEKEDEVLIETNLGPVLFARLPDMRIICTAKQHLIDNFTKLQPDLFKGYGQQKAA